MALQQGSVVSQFMALWTAFFQRAKRNSLSVCEEDRQTGQTDGSDRRVTRGHTSSQSATTGSPPGSVFLTVRVDLRLVFLGCDVREVTGAQAPHVHPLRGPRCHGRTQSCGLGHGGSHWTIMRQTKHIQNKILRTRHVIIFHFDAL